MRCLIYDHLFSSIAIHIFSTEDFYDIPGYNYELFLCETPSDHKETPLRYVECSRNYFQRDFPGYTIDQLQDTPVEPLAIGLGLLGTCRQLYHEAALMPFSKVSFATLARCPEFYSGVQRFVDALIPAQARAIARLRMTIHNGPAHPQDPNQNLVIGPIPSKTTLSKLKGLKDLEIILAPVIEVEREADASLFISGLEKVFALTPAMQSLVKLRLRSLRVTMHAEFDYSVPMFGQRGGRDALEAWLRETEMRLHFGSVLSGDTPLPDFGVVQDDERISLPHWATPEGIEKNRVRIENEERKSELRQQALSEGRMGDFFKVLYDDR